MKILWLCNMILPEIAEHLQRPHANTGGWLVGLSKALYESDSGTELTIVFPQSFSTDTVSGKSEHFSYWGFYRAEADLLSVSEARKDLFEEILKREQPQIVHVFGSEFISSYEMLEAVSRQGLLDQTVLSIQGLVGKCAEVYEAGMEEKYLKPLTLRDVMKKDSIKAQKDAFAVRGEYERKALRMVKHVIGRTVWDRACAEEINPSVQYHHCGETLRPSFLGHTWKYENCIPHTIFLSQGYYPLKGLHTVLEAMPLILKQYPDTKIRVTGRDILHLGWKEQLKISSYPYYLQKRIGKLGLKDKIVFNGSLNEEEMIREYLHANVFLCPSSLENSSNSVGEAQLLGVPVAASKVGGLTTIVNDGSDGLLYPFGDIEQLAERVCRIFAMKEKAEAMGEAGKERAKVLYDGKRNNAALMKIYAELSEAMHKKG